MNISTPIQNAVPFGDLIHAVDSPMFIVSDQGHGDLIYAQVNRAQEALSGFDPGSLSGQRPVDVLPARLARSVIGKYNDCIQTGVPRRYEQGFRLHGRDIWWQITLTPLPPQRDGAKFVLGTVNDITEAKLRLFDAYARAAQLERRYEELKVLTTVTAHDMRTPLGNVSSLVDLVLDGFEDLGDDKVMMIRKCGAISVQALAQLDVIMSHARQLDATPVPLSRIDLAQVCEDTCTMVDPRGETDITYPQTQVTTDRMLLQCCLHTVLKSAKDHGQGAITILAENDSKEQGMLVFHVTDGQEVPAVPGRFAARDLGLTTTRAQLRCRGGELTVSPAPPDGLGRVSFSLPGSMTV